MKALLAILLGIMVAASASAETMRRGDVIVPEYLPLSITQPISPIERFRADGRIAQLLGGEVGNLGAAFSPDGRLFVTSYHGIATFDASGAWIRNLEGDLFQGSALAFDRSGAFYLLDFYDPAHLQAFDGQGHLVRRITSNAPLGVYSIDLASDQCTLYLKRLDDPVIRRFDACRGEAMSDLTSSAGAGGIRIGTDGTIYSAAGDRVLRFSRAGALVGTYPIRGWDRIAKIAFDPDDGRLWIANDAAIAKVDLVSGEVVAGPMPTYWPATDLLVVGEPRAALLAATIPTASPIVLAILAAALTAIGVARLPHS